LPGGAKQGIFPGRRGFGLRIALSRNDRRDFAFVMVKDIFGKLIHPAPDGKDSPRERHAEPPAVVALVADIEGAGGRAVTTHIADTLATCPGLAVRLANKRMKTAPEATFVEKLAAAGAVGRSWLAGEGADVLVWGDAIGTEGGAIVRFLPAQIDAEAKTGSFGLGDALELPAGFGSKFGDILAAATVAAAVPAKAGHEDALGPVLSGAIARVSAYVEAPPSGLTAAQSVSMLTCLGNCFAALWRVNANDAHLDRAIRVYRLALDSCPRVEMRLPHAMLQNHLAAAFEAHAGRGKADENLEEAAKAYHAVAATLGQGEHPTDWAFAQNRLGMVLYRLALMRNSDPAHLKAAAKAFEAAREVFTRDDAPDRWAELTNQIGVTMMALGSQVAGTDALESSVKAFREALVVRRRNVAPLLWAQTANNLGAASFALSRRKTVPGLLDEAVQCFEGARQVYSQYGQHKTVAVIEKNLTRVRERMSRR